MLLIFPPPLPPIAEASLPPNFLFTVLMLPPCEFLVVLQRHYFASCLSQKLSCSFLGNTSPKMYHQNGISSRLEANFPPTFPQVKGLCPLHTGRQAGEYQGEERQMRRVRCCVQRSTYLFPATQLLASILLSKWDAILPDSVLPISGSRGAPRARPPCSSFGAAPTGGLEKQQGSAACSCPPAAATTSGMYPLSFLPHMMSPGQPSFPSSLLPMG